MVEDNLLNQRVLATQLRRLGHEVSVADNSEAALEFIRTTKYWTACGSPSKDLGVILMDVEMPVMDGITCARKIRELQQSGEIRGHLPIIAVSANARLEQVQQALACGMDDTISKPFRIVDLIPKIERLVV